ncbi:MAG TPA: penicillin-binding protein 2 [Myxococcota bacterium]|nr:penicillin-binding protein 2 [Myxococcota bacterium]
MPDRKHTRWMQIRLLVITGFLALCAGVVVYRVFNLQVRQASWLRELSRQQYLKEITLEPMRGQIVDRHGAPLAVSVMTESVFAMPGQMQDPRGAAGKLAAALELDHTHTTSLLAKLTGRKHFTWVKRRLAPRLAGRVHALNIKGVHFTRESRRFYPARELAASVVGFAGDGRGLEGIELIFDGLLRGETVLAQGLRDAHGNLLLADGIGQHNSNQGGGVVLTIDSTIQEIVETELENTLRRTGAKAASAIVMEPASGRILALANTPGFNPNTFWKFKAADYRNRTVTDCYEPGSTMKVFTMAAALSAGVVDSHEKIDCHHGSLKIGSHTIHDSHRGGFGLLDPTEILVHSSNIGMAEIGGRLGRKRLYSAFRRFGFGRRTAVDLPGESRCRLRKPKGISDVGLATISFGQGVSVTPLQLVTALCAVANRGVWMRPLVIREIRGPQGELVQEFDPDPAGRVMKAATAERLIAMMEGVTRPGGTGPRAAIEGYTVAGKTGTAQKADPIAGGYSEDKRVASFMGFVPADKPRIAVLVMVDEPQSSPYGGVVAAPAFARIAGASLRYMGVFPRGSAYAALQQVTGLLSTDRQKAGLEDFGGASAGRPSMIDGEVGPGIGTQTSGNTDGFLGGLSGLSVREAVARLYGRGFDVVVHGTGRVMDAKLSAGVVQLILEHHSNVPDAGPPGTELAALSGKEGGR